jgi:UDP-glucose 4-epimerase
LKESFPVKKEILVVGGAGYIGSHACLRLAEKGYTPVVVDNLSTGFRSAVQWGPFYETDIFDQEGLGKVFQNHEIQGVMHLQPMLMSENPSRIL